MTASGFTSAPSASSELKHNVSANVPTSLNEVRPTRFAPPVRLSIERTVSPGPDAESNPGRPSSCDSRRPADQIDVCGRFPRPGGASPVSPATTANGATREPRSARAHATPFLRRATPGVGLQPRLAGSTSAASRGCVSAQGFQRVPIRGTASAPSKPWCNRIPTTRSPQSRPAHLPTVRTRRHWEATRRQRSLA